jgi:hypothetical protein
MSIADSLQHCSLSEAIAQATGRVLLFAFHVQQLPHYSVRHGCDKTTTGRQYIRARPVVIPRDVSNAHRCSSNSMTRLGRSLNYQNTKSALQRHDWCDDTVHVPQRGPALVRSVLRLLRSRLPSVTP